MKKILIATHGHLASGIQSSIGILTGNKESVQAVDAYVDDSDYTEKIQAFLDSVEPDDEAVIFTDIYGGSVFQKVALLHPEKYGVIRVTGVNLPAVIQVLLSSEPITADSVDALVGEAREYLVRVNPLPEEGQCLDESDDGSDDGFFD